MSNAKTTEQILNEVTAASEGAIARAANRGWSSKEQARCGKDAADAVLNEYGFKSYQELIGA